MSDTSIESITVLDLYAAINSGAEPLVRNYERTINEYYPLPDIPSLDDRGFRRAVNLYITHDKNHKRYRADVSLATIKDDDGWFTTSHSIGGGRVGERFMIEPTARYSAAKLADFTRRARAQIARMGAAA